MNVMKNDEELLRVALRDAAGRDSCSDMCLILEKMLDDGHLRRYSRVKQGGETDYYWTSDGSMLMLDRIVDMDCYADSLLLELFLEQKVYFVTIRQGVPGIYFFPCPREVSKQ